MRKFEEVFKRQTRGRGGLRMAFPILKKNQWRRNDVRGLPVIFRCECGGSAALRESEISDSGVVRCFLCEKLMLFAGFHRSDEG